jgi:hypothetical protein
LSIIQATGVSVRHAISRALATANLTPREATYRVLTARVHADGRGNVARGEVSLRIQQPATLASLPPQELVGWVNPDGSHPLMALFPTGRSREGQPELAYMDIHPVTWDAWLRVMDDALPDRIDALCPVTGVAHDQALAYAAAIGARLPSAVELSTAWGEDRYPWGHKPDTRLGRVGRPRFDHIPPVGGHPPSSFGMFDLGCWLWHWLDDGRLYGGADELEPGFGVEPTAERGPVGFRCVMPYEGLGTTG